MADVELIPGPLDSQPLLVSQDPASDARGEHEASDVVDQNPAQPEVVHDDAKVESEVDEPAKDASDEAVPPATKKTEASPKSPTAPSKSKSTVQVKSTSGRVTSSTPADKRASTLVTGNVKAASLGKTTATSPSSPLSKSVTSTPSAPKRPSTTSANSAKTAPMASSRGSNSGPTPPSRRSSMLPPRAPSATGAPAPKSRTSTLLASLSSSTSSKPPPAEANMTSRPSVVSPAGSVASLKSSAASGVPTARSTISDALKRTPSSTRQNLPTTSAPPPQSRAMRPIGSISSIREVRDDGRAVEDLQEKLRAANEALSAKSNEVAALDAKVLQLEASLGEAIVDSRTKTSSIEQLQISKQSLDADIRDLRVRLQQVQAEHSRDVTALRSARQELRNANESTTGHTEKIKTLEAQIETLQADIVAAQENFESLRSSSDQSAAAAAAAAQMEREAFIRAKADVESITAEVNTLRTARDRALQDAAARVSESQQRAADVTALTTQLGELKAEREESATKISELEVEILELRESQEKAEDEHKMSLDRLRKLEAELAGAVRATQQALQDAEARDVANARKAADTASLHADLVQAIKSDLAQAVSEVQILKAELTTAHVTHEETKAVAQATAEAHEQEMEEAEQSYLSKHIELSEEIKRLSSELEAEDAKYTAKLDAVKADYDQRLQEAFEQARNKAGEAHGQDLQVLRSESQATIEQLRATHESMISDLQAEHAAAVESQVSTIEKKLNNQSLELRATQDDLSKAKAALDNVRAEGESLRAQLEDARVNSVAASADADQAVEIERLTQEIAKLRDENVMLNDVLVITKESLSEMSTNHSKELEEAARVRAEEVMRLRSAHDGELSTLAAQKSEMTLSLSDLEGEIAMLKARLAAVEPTAAPRSNGAVHVSATTVTRDELHKVYEAHNLKMHDLQAEHERVVRALRTEVEALQARLDEVQEDVARKSMEIQYLEQEQEESQDSITRLKADLEARKSVGP